MAVLPAEAEERMRVEIRGFFSEEGFEAPANIGALPGAQTVATGGEPIELDEVKQDRKF